MLALGGVTIVMLSVLASLGFYGYVGVPATLIVIEVGWLVVVPWCL